MAKKITDKIKELRLKIKSISTDAHYADTLVSELLELKEAQDGMNKEIDIPTSELKDTLDLGPWSLSKTRRGILFTAKGGMQLYVDMSMTSVYSMLNEVFEVSNNKDKYGELSDQYINAVAYICQCPIFASLSQQALFTIATEILKTFNEYCDINFSNAKNKEYTEADYIADIEHEQIADVIDMLTESQSSPEV